jgi:hypothetical protein
MQRIVRVHTKAAFPERRKPFGEGPKRSPLANNAVQPFVEIEQVFYRYMILLAWLLLLLLPLLLLLYSKSMCCDVGGFEHTVLVVSASR